MANPLGPVSEVYRPPAPNHLADAPLTDSYRRWGYSIGYELDEHGTAVPPGGNTAVFRIAPHGLTEPVFVTKPEQEATFTVNVLGGNGLFVRATPDGQVEELPLTQGTQVVVRPGEAYSYVNTSEDHDLILHDVALPAFQPDDEVDLTMSHLVDQAPTPQAGYSICVARTNTGDLLPVELPSRFFERLGQLSLLP